MTFPVRLVGALLLLGLLASPAQAGPHDFVVYIARLGGDTETARPYVAKFAAHLEKLMGWKKGSCQGAFFADRKDALAHIKKTQPGFAVLDPPLYLELREAEGLQLVGQLRSTELVSDRLLVVVKDARLTSLEQLKGKQLTTTLAESPRYLSRVVFDGKLEADQHFKLKRVGTALKGVRGVLTGKSEATLIDDDQLKAAGKMEGGKALRAIHTSPRLPPAPVAVFSKVMKPAEASALEKALPRVCTGAGATICKEMQLPPFQPRDPAPFAAAQQRYDR